MDFVQNFTTEVGQTAENLLHKTFPKKIAELDKSLRDPEFSLKNIEKIRRCSWTSLGVLQNNEKKVSVNEGLQSVKIADREESRQVEVNKAITNIMDRLRAEITGLIDYCNILRLWVTLLLPKIEDGNNFGRSVQEETVNEVQNAECELALYLSQISNYFSSRAKIATKIIKNPHVHDYYRYIAEEDEKQFVNFRLMLVDIRNTYSSIHDLILKNIEKIKRPRNSNYGSMY